MTLISVEPDSGRPRLALVGGAVAPRLVRADATGAKVALVATTALLLGGDHVEIDVRVGPGAWLEIVETAGTVAYDAQGELSTWTVRATVADGGLLLWHGEPFVVSTGANTVRSSTFEVGEMSTVCLRETTVLGRSGEQGGAVRTLSRAGRAGTPLLAEDLDLSGGSQRRQPGILGAATVVDTVTWLGSRAPVLPAVDAGSRFDLADDAGGIARTLRREVAGSPAAKWWEAWSGAARAAHGQHASVHISSGEAQQQRPSVSLGAARTPEPV